MYIKSIVLDGFKSYGNRVEVTGFDPEFNAITGLNGTGKSNILDSICFVLGITNLSNVRAGSLQELIYKHGQAGITKATVSITFDNRDKRRCPVGYENHDEITVTRQVVMGGKNKYLINGINVQNKRVADLFCSVQLNVNNPHFLIMQGRITKVLNMKPPEILSMVEEAAGTRMYEAKKQAAQKTIEKKDAKLRELNDIIKEDIAPKLQKLQDERSQFQEYQKVVRELENLTRLHVAWRYVTAEESAKEAEAKVTEVEDEIQTKNDSIKSNEKQAKELDKQIADLTKKLDEVRGAALRSLQDTLSSQEQEEAATAAAARAAGDALRDHERRARLLDQAMADDERALRDKHYTLNQVSATFEQLKAASAEAETALAAARDKFLAVSSGLEGAADSLQDQLMAAKQEASEASTLVSQCRMEREHCLQRLKELEKEHRSQAGLQLKEQRQLEDLTLQLRQLESELSASSNDEQRCSALKQSCLALQRSTRTQRDALEALSARLQRTDFNYSDPEPGFDRTRVKGTVCKLIEVSDPIYCTALETAAGGRLYNVVVDSEKTSKALLQRGRLQQRTTIIPLDRISGHAIDRDTVRLAQDIGGGPSEVQLALSLVSFPAAVTPAMTWVFGQTLVCRTLASAKRVTFDARVRRRCVTLDGDVFDPSGTLSGGARVKGEPVLLQLQRLRQMQLQLQRDESQLQRDNTELQQLQRALDEQSSKQQRYETVRMELEVVKQRVQGSAHAQAQSEIESLRARTKELDDRLAAAAAAARDATTAAAELDHKMKDIKGHREREFKKAESALKAAQATHERHSAAWRDREQEYETLRMETEELQRAVRAGREQLDSCVVAAVELKEQHEARLQLHATAAEAVKATAASIKKQKAEIAASSGDVARLQQRKEALKRTDAELALAIKELQYKVGELRAEAADCAKRITSLSAEHPWVSSEKQYFGLAGGLYDFTARGGAAAGQRLAQLAARRDKLARGLNARAHTLLGKEEEQYQDVMRKKQIVEADRAKLVQVMAELDEKKKRTLVAAAEQVNKDFGSIFSTLLPGAQAQLVPPSGGSVLHGLEVKVGFNGRWKESLGELSGGQRSLVALALVLAMLLCKPAPLYILDEVDAALDLSHTQNIGQMLKEHFKHSQFIIVSLKDGMFNNANVLFRTKFVDGMSSVQRTVSRR